MGVEIGGVPEELLEVEVSQAKLESLGVSLTEIYSAVRNNNVLIPAGFQDTGSGKFAVEIPSIFETRQDVFDLPIKSDGNKVVKMGDVADIKELLKTQLVFQGLMVLMQFLFQSLKELVSMSWILLKLCKQKLKKLEKISQMT